MRRIDYAKLSFLVIDDDAVTRRIVGTMLGAFGARDVALAEDGLAGVDAAFMGRPDIILLDWALPLLSGIEVIARLRGPDSPNPQVPLIMMSSYGREAEIAIARDAGVTEFLAKPFSATALHQHIAAVLIKPRTFIRATAFRGPDRRRRVGADRDLDRRRAATTDAS